MSIEFNKSKDERLHVLCQNCKRRTNHTVLLSADESGAEDWGGGAHYYWNTKFQIVQCQGCDAISFRTESTNSEDMDEDGYAVTEAVYPRRTEETINARQFLNLPYKLKRLYGEVIESYNNGILLLCAGGVRAIVEGICKENHIENGLVEVEVAGETTSRKESSLQGKIHGLYEKGILTKQNADVLHEHRYLGNNALHDLDAPSMQELALAINIVEHVLEAICEIPAKGEKLKRTRKGDIPF